MSINKKVEAAAISGAGILFVHDGKILLIYRSADVVDPNLWCGAGGKIEPGETPEEAAVREASEEIGYTEDDTLELIPLYVYNSDKLVFHNFVGLLPRERFRPTLNWESEGYGWFTLDKLPNNLHYGFQEILDDKEASTVLKDAMEK
jgi:8-oxo-dGTP pyrophosphatase MutT (NUDIX family)